MEKRFKDIKKAGMIGILGNIFLLIIKGFIGFVTKSQSMIADAFNSASDILASLMTFIGSKISSEPKDEDHNLGHGKAEYIYAMLISIVLIFVSLSLFKDSFLAIINKNIDFNYCMYFNNYNKIIFIYIYKNII